MASPSSSPTAITTTRQDSSILNIDPASFEQALHSIHAKAKRTAKLDSTADDDLLAKLACYAIRELHAENIYPSTAIRAMSILEYAEERRSTGGAIKQAKREMRDEALKRREEWLGAAEGFGVGEKGEDKAKAKA